MFKPQEKNCRIAVIGIGCYYPGANSPLQLWENILSRRRQFREMPDVRLPNKEYYDPDPLVPNKTYQNKAAVLDGYDFNWLEKRIPKQTYDSTDIVHWLALDTALQALADAGLDKESIPKEATGVILGNTLTGEFTRSNQMLLRWPYVRKALRLSARQKGLTHILDDLESTMEENYKSVFAPVTEDTLAGGLANTIAGRVCNFLDIHGGGYIVDGACSSSLLAIVTAANFLELNQMDMVIAGGVDISLDTFELIGFAKTGALTPDEMRVYDVGGKGFLPGEGCGMVVLKRLEDAINDKDQIYAIINGWGISSDGKGGITAPSAAGQSRALMRAYSKAEFDTSKLHFIEGHGTGTTVGDRVELEGISIALNSRGEIPPRSCGVTSFKSIVGHTKAAAGIGAFIKTAMAVNQRIMPPTAGLKEPNPIFNDKAKSIYPITRGQICKKEDILYAGVSAMGFGGINSHVIIQSGDSPNPKLKTSLEESKLLVSNQSHELYCFTADTKEEMIILIDEFLKDSSGLSYAEMADLAYLNNKKADLSKPLRSAIVADTPFELQRKIIVLNEKIKDWNDKNNISIENNSIVAAFKKDNLRIGAVFPGQGSQKLNMNSKLIERNDWIKEIVNRADCLFANEDANNIISSVYRKVEMVIDTQQLSLWQTELKQTNIAQPAITLSSLLWYEYLQKLGVNINCASGHSLGELMAFYAAGFLDMETLLKFSVFRGKAMARNGSGTMASLQCSKEKAEELISQIRGYVTIANLNSPEQTIVSGESESIKNLIRLAQNNHINSVELSVSAAFHSELVSEAGKEVKQYSPLKLKGNKKHDINLISSTNGKKVDENIDLNEYFSFQTVNKVDFISTVYSLEKNCDILLEIGPGKVLSGLVNNISGDLKCFPVEVNSDDDLSLNLLLANIFVSGCNIKLEEIYKNRLIRQFTPAYKKSFLVNPLERPFLAPEIYEAESQSTGLSSLINYKSSSVDFDEYIKIRGNYIKEIIDTDYRYFIASENLNIQKNTGKKKPALNENIKEDSDWSKKSSIDIRSILFEKIESMTGFSSKEFRENMKLLDDFNLDSIKSGSLINGLAKSFNITGKINASELSNASLKEIIARFDKIIEIKPEISAAIVKETSKAISENEVPQIVYKIVAEKTGFPPEMIRPEYKLLDDLNLDSIKAGALVSELAKKFDIKGRIESSKLANANLEDIVDYFTSLLSAGQESKKEEIKDVKNTSWINAFSVSLVEEPALIDKKYVQEFWQNKSLVLVHSDEDYGFAAELSEILKSHVSKVVIVGINNLNLLTSFENSCLMILIPNSPIRLENLNRIVSLFSDVAKHIADTGFLGFLQFNDGSFLRNGGNSFAYPVNYSSVSFASSIHHERPDINIRVIEVANQISKNEIPELILKEFTIGNSYEIAGYDKDLIRRKMRYDHITATQNRKIDLNFNTDDVLLATGGAKGITAECVLSFARKYKCKTALIGSSSKNEEIQNTISRFEKEDLIVRYYSCDISDINALQTAINSVEQELGKITVVIHGAGKNIPRRAENVAFKEAIDEISPKLIGAMNVCEVLKDNELKYFIALTSIIGITGMPGNSWYAFSNENLDLFLRETGKKRHFNVRTYAYSIWDEVGMGVRLGSNKILADMGIGSISPILGVQQFIRWIENKSNDQQVVITAGLGGLDTWNTKKPKLPKANRYISDIKYFEPGREIITRARLSRLTDLYIDDHNYGGSLLFPTVFGLEAMAQAALMLTGMEKTDNLIFENVSLEKPIVVPENGDIEIGIKATIIEGGIDSSEPVRIYAGVSTEYAGFSSFHFSAELLFNVRSDIEKRDVNLQRESLKISPKSDLYTWLLFQGPRFQNIKKLYDLKSDSVEFVTDKIEKDPSDQCFAESVKSPFLIGSPLLRDVLLQSVQLFLTSKKYLPVGIKRWELHNINKQIHGGYVISKLSELTEDRGICNVEFIVNGEVNEKIEGYQVKALEPTPGYPNPASISDIGSFYQKRIEDEFNKYQSLLAEKIIYKLYKHDVEFNYVNKKARHAIEDNLFQNAISENKEFREYDGFNISRSANGKPSVNKSELNISFSHSRTLLLMTLGFKDQGCDIEFIEKKSRHEWDDLLEGKYSKTFDQLNRIDNDLNISGTRLWCVREALIKSTGSIPLSINVEKIHEKGIVFKVKTGEKDMMVLTFPVEVLPSVTAVFSSIVYLKDSEMLVTESRTEQSKHAGLFNKDLKGFSHSFLTTFKDCKGTFGKTHFTNYPDWMGTLRELVLEPIGKELLRDLGSGQYGMVTNTSEVMIFNEADTLNQITGNLWITNKSELDESFIDLNFEFLKTHPETNSYIRLAKCNLSTTWVKIESRGIVKKSPIPEYFITFLKRYLLRSEADNIIINGNNYPSLKDMGKVLYENTDKIRPQALVAEQEFKTGISNSNTVGNLYYSNYYYWQSKIIEQYLYKIAPEIVINNGKGGEFLTLETNVKHLQEAMPFETIDVFMYIEKLYQSAIKFHFEYFSKEGSNKRKLAYGSNIIIWAKRNNETSLPVVQQLPQKLYKAIDNLTLA